MKPGIQLQMGQQLTMTPQLQQAIKLLQLSTLDLQMEIQQVLQSNPLLEVDEGDEDPGAEGEQEEREPLAQASEGPMEHLERSAGDDDGDGDHPEDRRLVRGVRECPFEGGAADGDERQQHQDEPDGDSDGPHRAGEAADRPAEDDGEPQRGRVHSHTGNIDCPG